MKKKGYIKSIILMAIVTLFIPVTIFCSLNKDSTKNIISASNKKQSLIRSTIGATSLNSNAFITNGIYLELDCENLEVDWSNEATLDNQIKSFIIVNFKNTIWNNLPNDITLDDIEIVSSDFSGVDGYYRIKEIKLSKYYNNLGEIVTTPKNFIPNSKYIEFKNLKRIPTSFNVGSDINGIGTINQVSNQLVEWNAKLFYESKYQLGSVYDTSTPSEFLKDDNTCLIDQWVIKNLLLKNVPTKNSSFEAILKNRTNFDNHGYIEFDLQLKGINDANGQIVSSYGSIIKLRLVGLAIGTNDTIVNKEVQTNGILATNPIASYSTNQIVGLENGDIYDSIKSWIISNFNDIFSNYSNNIVSTNDISKMSILASDRESVIIDITLNYAIVNDVIQAASFQFKIYGFNQNYETEINPTVAQNGIDATDPIDKFIVSEVINNSLNREIVKQWVIDNINKILIDYPKDSITSSDITNFEILEVNNINNSIQIQMTIRTAQLSNGTIGIKSFNFKINNLTIPQEVTTIKSSINIDSLNIQDINSSTYSIDIVNSTKSKIYQNQIINAMNNNPLLFLDNPPSEKEINNRPIINPNADINFTINSDNVTIRLEAEFLTRTNNINNLAIYSSRYIDITNFNDLETIINPKYENSGIIINELANYNVNDVFNNAELQNIILEYLRNNLNSIFSNISQSFIDINSTKLSFSNIQSYQKYGYITVDITVSQVFINNVYTSKIFSNVIVKGFNVPSTVAKTITATQLENAAKQDLNQFQIFSNSSNFFGSDFANIINNDIIYNNKLIQLINTYPDFFLESSANVSNIVKQGTQLVASLNSNQTSITITGQFYQIKAQTNDTIDKYEQMSITINNFSDATTTVDSSVIDIDKILGSSKDEYSSSAALEKINQNKDIFVQEVLEKQNKIFLNAPSNFNLRLEEALNNAVFEIKDNTIIATIDRLPVAIDGVIEISSSLDINLGTFNSFSLYTMIEFNNINANTSTGASLIFDIFKNYGWTDDWKDSNLDEMGNLLKNYLNNNKDRYFRNLIPNVDPVSSLKILRTSDIKIYDVELVIDGYVNGNRSKINTERKIILREFNPITAFSNYSQYLEQNLKYYNLPASEYDAVILIKQLTINYLTLVKNSMPLNYVLNNESVNVANLVIQNNTIIIPYNSVDPTIWFLNKNYEMVRINNSEIRIEMNQNQKNQSSKMNNNLTLVISLIGLAIVFVFIIILIFVIVKKTGTKRIV